MKLLSRIRLLVTPWAAAHQAPPSKGFSRQEYWSGVPLRYSVNIDCIRTQKPKKPYDLLYCSGIDLLLSPRYVYTYIRDLARWRKGIGSRRRNRSKHLDMEKSMGCWGIASVQYHWKAESAKDWWEKGSHYELDYKIEWFIFKQMCLISWHLMNFRTH